MGIGLLMAFEPRMVNAQDKSAYVNIYYDAKNQWFVYEWENEGEIVRGGYDPPNKVKPFVKATVVFDGRDTYSYRYEVGNQEGAVQVLEDIFISHKSPVFDATAPFPEKDWFMGEYRDYNEWEWAKESALPAGEVAKGFSFSSKGLPAVVEASFYGAQRVRTNMPGDYDSLEVNDAFSELYDKIEEQYADKFKDVVVKVVGPGEVPKDFNALTFVDSIIKMKHEAADLGWITNDGIVKSLDAKLDSAKKAIQGGNMTTAKNVLEAFIKEVEAQGCESYDSCNKGKHIKPEAWALLKFNAEYLLSKL